jgi:hypothetical protein
MNLTEKVSGYQVDSYGSEYGQVVDSGEYNTGPSGSMKGREFLD